MTLTKFQALFVKSLRSKNYSYRAIAREFTYRYEDFIEEYGVYPNIHGSSKKQWEFYYTSFNYGKPSNDLKGLLPWVSSNQMLGQDLVAMAQKILNEEID